MHSTSKHSIGTFSITIIRITISSRGVSIICRDEKCCWRAQFDQVQRGTLHRIEVSHSSSTYMLFLILIVFVFVGRGIK